MARTPSLDKQVDAFESSVKELSSLDNRHELPVEETERQTKLSSRELNKSKDIYLTPARTVSDTKSKFNEKFRKDYEFDKEYVQFIAEHKEIIGDNIEIWTKKYPGIPAEFWIVPTNKPIWGPRYLADQISKRSYRRLVMKQNVVTEEGSFGQMYGALAADTVVQRMEAYPVRSQKSRFGAVNF